MKLEPYCMEPSSVPYQRMVFDSPSLPSSKYRGLLSLVIEQLEIEILNLHAQTHWHDVVFIYTRNISL